MRSFPVSINDSGPIARFPSRGLRQEFLEQVRIWNKVEGLPTIETQPLSDGVRVRFWSGDSRQQNILRLIDSYGGWLAFDANPGSLYAKTARLELAIVD